MNISAMALLVVGFVTPVQAGTLSSSEKIAVRRVEQAGGTFEWVQEDGRLTFCLDVNAKEKPFDFEPLVELKSLRVLRVFQGKIDEKSLVHLPKLKSLELLVITSDGLTNKGLKSIGKLVGLTKLDVKSENLTEVGPSEFLKLKSLKRLFLYNTKITDSSLNSLCRLTWLSELCVPKTVSEAGLTRLRIALPKASVRSL